MLNVDTFTCLSATDEDGHLVVPSDSLQLLPARLPYELLGPCILAAVDSLAAAARPANKHTDTQADNKSSGASQAAAHQQLLQAQPACQQQQQQVALQLYGIDLQEPITGPLVTCFQAYSFLQQLSLQELNVDAHAAAAIASMVQHTPSACSSQQAASGLVGLTLKHVFMGHTAWKTLLKGIAAGCQLQTLR
jgi:hypothetical protein